MEFVIPAGSSANLPKELVDKIVHEAVEKSIVLKLIDQRGNNIEIVNEGTIPVLGGADVDKVYRIDGTTDITTLSENDFDIKTPDLDPVEMGTYFYLKLKQIAQYPELKLDELFRQRISEVVGRAVDSVAVVGDTTAVGSTNRLNIADGIYTLANTACANTPVEYTTSAAQNVCDAVGEAIDDMGLYGDAEHAQDLIMFASAAFVTACRKSAVKETIGYEIADYAPLGLKNVIHIHGIPVIKRSLITGEQAVLVNMKGAYTGYYGNMVVDVEHKAGRRSDLLVLTFWFDFEWALKDGSSNAEGMIIIKKGS